MLEKILLKKVKYYCIIKKKEEGEVYENNKKNYSIYFSNFNNFFE